MIDNIKFIDSHVHLDLICKHKPERISWLKETGCLPVSWAYSPDVKTARDIGIYLDEQRKIINELNAAGVPCFFLAGIHPRNITDDMKPGDIRGLVLRSLDDPYCLGVGEIGLETGSEREMEMLESHLELAEEVTGRGKVFGVHTPRDDKARVTAGILPVLKKYRKYAEKIVVDHCTEETIGTVIEAGFRAGVSVSPIKISAAELARIIIHNPGYVDSIMLNTDSGGKFFDDIHVFRSAADMPEDIIKKITLNNAKLFYNI